MTLLRTVNRNCRRFVGERLYVERDERTDMWVQRFMDTKIFLRRRSDYLSYGEVGWLCENVYFREYCPHDHDTVVDFGAGYGHEAVWLHYRSPKVKYFGIEVQPSIYECLSNTFHVTSKHLKAVPFAVTSAPDPVFISSESTYVKASTAQGGYVEVATKSWPDLKRQYAIQTIDLLKVNIEGAEVGLVSTLGEMADIRRIIVSAHDFRAEAGDGEHFRTRERVVHHLKVNGFKVNPLSHEPWMRDWIFAAR